MCTLILLHRPAPGVRLVVAANRDEYLDRPACGPTIHRRDGAAILAPLDLRAGGTWLGLNRAGLFAALTNRPNASPDPARRSRGLLVLDALRAPSAARAAEVLAALPAGAYNPFNLVVADGARAFAAVYAGGAPRVTELAPGAHVVGNADPDDRSVAKVDRLLGEVERVAAGPAGGWLDGLAAVCRGHDGAAPLGAACVHHGGYGTRSSTLLRLDDDRTRSELHFADGPPCRTSYRNLTFLLRELPRTGGVAAGATALGGTV